MKGALKNIRVLDLSRVLAGPVCTQILGDLGAEIIKVEKPFEGDDTRKWGPPFLKDAAGNDTNESAYYLSANRNKKSLAIDIKHKEGQALIHKLLEQSDVFIENFKTGGLAKYGLSFADIQKKHPHIIYCSITGFGQTGPMAQEPGYDFLAQALSGLMAITGEPDGQPMKAGVALSDVMTGLYAAIGILAALNARQNTGKGQHVDVSLVDCTLASMVNIAQYYLTTGTLAPRLGNAHSAIVPYQAFEAKDGHIVIAVGNDGQFKRFCAAAGKGEWADDPRFATNASRVTHRDELVPHIITLIKTKTMQEWVSLLNHADVSCGPVNKMDEVFAMQQVQAREMEIEVKHQRADKSIKLVGSPLKLSDTPVSYNEAPPVTGQHSAEILQNLLKLSAEEVSKLADQKIIQQG